MATKKYNQFINEKKWTQDVHPKKGKMHDILGIDEDKKISDVYKSGSKLAEDLIEKVGKKKASLIEKGILEIKSLFYLDVLKILVRFVKNKCYVYSYLQKTNSKCSTRILEYRSIVSCCTAVSTFLYNCILG